MSLNSDRKVPDLKIKNKEEVDLVINHKRSTIEAIITICRVHPIGNKAVRAWNAFAIFGQLISQTTNDLMRMYLSDAENAIHNYIREADMTGHKITDDEFRNYVEEQIDFACDRLLHCYDMP